MISVLVTGALGMLGHRIVRSLSQHYNVIGWDIADQNKLEISCKLYKMDLTDFKAVDMAIRELKPQITIHTAALINVDQCEKEPDKAHFLNMEMTENLAKAVNSVDGRLIFISTDAVFDGQKAGPYSEGDPTDPVNVYGQSKLSAERAVMASSPQNTVLRTNIYGWNIQPKVSFAEWVYFALQKGEPLNMFTDVMYSPIYTGHFASFIQVVIGKGISGIHHAAGGQHCSKYEFAMHLSQVFGLDPSSIQAGLFDDAGLVAKRNKNMCLDSSSFARLADVKLPGLTDGLLCFKEDWQRW